MNSTDKYVLSASANSIIAKIEGDLQKSFMSIIYNLYPLSQSYNSLEEAHEENKTCIFNSELFSKSQHLAQESFSLKWTWVM